MNLDEKLSGREYRRMTAIEARKAENEDKKIVEGYATTFDDEYLLYDWGDYRVMEKIDPHAFDKCDMSDVIMQYDHEGRVFARTRNKTLELTVDDHGLLVRADLGGTELGVGLYNDIQGGYIDRMSFGFVVGEDKREIVEDHEKNIVTVHRTITKIKKLYDVSAVSFPANDGTEISARNYCDGLIAEIKAERLAAEKAKAERENQIRKIKILSEV